MGVKLECHNIKLTHGCQIIMKLIEVPLKQCVMRDANNNHGDAKSCGDSGKDNCSKLNTKPDTDGKRSCVVINFNMTEVSQTAINTLRVASTGDY